MLKDVSTKELVEELKTREGVSAKIAEPYQDLSVKVNGPAIVMSLLINLSVNMNMSFLYMRESIYHVNLLTSSHDKPIPEH